MKTHTTPPSEVTELEAAIKWKETKSLLELDDLNNKYRNHFTWQMSDDDFTLHIYRNEVIIPWAESKGYNVPSYNDEMRFALYSREVLHPQVSETADKGDPEFELKMCNNCIQMTNHIGEVCQKCKPVSSNTGKSAEKVNGFCKNGCPDEIPCHNAWECSISQPNKDTPEKILGMYINGGVPVDETIYENVLLAMDTYTSQQTASLEAEKMELVEFVKSILTLSKMEHYNLSDVKCDISIIAKAAEKLINKIK